MRECAYGMAHDRPNGGSPLCIQLRVSVLGRYGSSAPLIGNSPDTRGHTKRCHVHVLVAVVRGACSVLEDALADAGDRAPIAPVLVTVFRPPA